MARITLVVIRGKDLDLFDLGEPLAEFQRSRKMSAILIVTNSQRRELNPVLEVHSNNNNGNIHLVDGLGIICSDISFVF